MRHTLRVFACGTLLVAATASAQWTNGANSTKCHKLTVSVVGGLCNGVSVTTGACGPQSVTDEGIKGKIKSMGEYFGVSFQADFCTIKKSSMDDLCPAVVGGTVRDICAEQLDEMCQFYTTRGDQCKTDADCPPTATNTRKPCCPSLTSQHAFFCDGADSEMMASFVSLNVAGAGCWLAACNAARRSPEYTPTPTNARARTHTHDIYVHRLNTYIHRIHACMHTYIHTYIHTYCIR